MSLDRQSIEKKDFPIGRRGYDPHAVDAHLGALADEVDELRRDARRRGESLAAAASEQVRAIVEAAETTASEIQRQAENEARDIRTEASSEAQATREQATTQARDYVGNVSESTAGMLQRLDAMESELNALFEALRTGSNRLGADLKLLEGNLEEVRDAVTPRPRFVPEQEGSTGRPVGADEELGATGLQEDAAAELDEEIVLVEESADETERLASAGGSGAGGDQQGGEEAEGARLIALNMALNGTPREETDRYLKKNFKLSDRRGLLDEVYSSVEG